MKKYYALSAVLTMLVFGILLAKNPYASTTINPAKVGIDQGAARMYVASGGSVDVESGGIMDFQSGAALKIAGTAISATAAEMNKVAGVTAGTVLASKAVVAGADKNVDVLAIADLKLGAGAGTSVTSTAAELNTLAAVVAGTVTASKAVVVGADKNVDVLAVADLKLGAGAGTSVTATAAQLNSVINGGFCVTGTCTETASVNAGALSVTKLQSLITSAGAETRTLAAPGGNGLLKIIAMTAHVGDVTMLGTQIWGQEAATCTFNAIGDSMVLISVGGKWMLLQSNSVTCA